MHFEVYNERYLTIFSKLISILNFHRRVWKADGSRLLEPEWSALSSNVAGSVVHTTVLEKKRAIVCSAKLWA